MGVMTLFQMILLIGGQLKARVSIPAYHRVEIVVHCVVTNSLDLIGLELEPQAV
jgi:hypothetical protein